MVRDPGIKLFGKTIGLPERRGVEAESAAVGVRGEGTSNRPTSSSSVDNPDPPEPRKDHSIDQAHHSKETPIPWPVMEESSEAAKTETGSAKSLKKPERALPCPRCDSADTKFCYFNNYNTNQPRHFCKSCQRYWTAGGSMRNVPVGAGRRKVKTSATQFRHGTAVRVDNPNALHLNPNGSVLTFSSDAPLCDSMASSLNIADKTVVKGGGHGSGHDQSSESSIASSSEAMGKQQEQQMPCFPGVLWPYPWNSVVPPPTFAYASFPPRFYSTGAPFIGYSVPGSWPPPWIIPPAPASPSSPTLGKHSRDDSSNVKSAVLDEENLSEKSFWVPKTLRIDGPGEAAKSTICATLGIDDNGADSEGGGRSLFKAFQRQNKEKESQETGASSVLQANPAALSRSFSFHERS